MSQCALAQVAKAADNGSKYKIQDSASKAHAYLQAATCTDDPKEQDSTSGIVKSKAVLKQGPVVVVPKVLSARSKKNPTEDDLLQDVRWFYTIKCRAVAKTQTVCVANPGSKKNVLNYLRGIYGTKPFSEFGFGTFEEWSKRHNLGIYDGFVVEEGAKNIVAKRKRPCDEPSASNKKIKGGASER